VSKFDPSFRGGKKYGAEAPSCRRTLVDGDTYVKVWDVSGESHQKLPDAGEPTFSDWMGTVYQIPLPCLFRLSGLTNGIVRSSRGHSSSNAGVRSADGLGLHLPFPQAR
jgi:hypothetical protein